jgi:hypothetical protein
MRVYNLFLSPGLTYFVFLNSEIGPLSDVGDLNVPDSTQDPLPPPRPVADEVMVSHGAHSAIATKSTVTQTEGGVKPVDMMAESEPCSPALQSSAVIVLTGQSLPYTIGKKTENKNICCTVSSFFSRHRLGKVLFWFWIRPAIKIKFLLMIYLLDLFTIPVFLGSRMF